MADKAEQVADEATSVEETTADSQSETQAQDSNASSTEQAGENQGEAESQADTASTGDNSKSENQDSKQDSKPVSRRSAAYRIQQLVKENDQLKKQVGKPLQEQDDWEQPADDGPKPDIQALIDAAVEKRLNPIVSESSKTADDVELSELFSGKPEDRSKYESKIRSYWNLPQYKDVAAQDIFNMLRGSEIEQSITQAKQQAIEEFKKAEREAKDSSASGSSNTSNRTGKGGKSVSDMTDEEFRQHNERVKAGQA
jgi:hypothetical protein